MSYLAKADCVLLLVPSAKADGNEGSQFIAVGFNQRIKMKAAEFIAVGFNQRLQSLK